MRKLLFAVLFLSKAASAAGPGFPFSSSGQPSDGATLNPNLVNISTPAGTATAALPLEIGGTNINGTGIGLTNSSAGGGKWTIRSSGSNNGGGPGNLIFQETNNGTQLIITSTGNIFVSTGTTLPAADIAFWKKSLSILTDGGNSSTMIQATYDTASNLSSNFFLRRAGGSFSAPTAVSNSSRIGRIFFSAHDGTSFLSTIAGINSTMDSSGVAAPSSMPSNISFHTTSPNTAAYTQKAVITSTGEFVIGGASNIGVSTLTFAGGIDVSSASYFGVQYSTQAAGGAGAAVTALCNSGRFVMSGGCECSGGVAVTGFVARPSGVIAGGMPTGWTCQQPGGTGGACAAFAICSTIQIK